MKTRGALTDLRPHPISDVKHAQLYMPDMRISSFAPKFCGDATSRPACC
jgi:hypothetical protein